jgi:hypothetical protein
VAFETVARANGGAAAKAAERTDLAVTADDDLGLDDGVGSDDDSIGKG